MQHRLTSDCSIVIVLNRRRPASVRRRLQNSDHDQAPALPSSHLCSCSTGQLQRRSVPSDAWSLSVTALRGLLAMMLSRTLLH